MKKYLFIAVIVFVAIASWGFNNEEQEPAKPQYVMVSCSTTRNTIIIYSGSTKTQEMLEFRKGLNFQDKIMDALNTLGERGYDLVSSNTHIIPSGSGAYSYTEFYYTLKLK